MRPIRRNHENWTCVLIAQLGIRQKRGEGLVACPGLINGIFARARNATSRLGRARTWLVRDRPVSPEPGYRLHLGRMMKHRLEAVK